MKILAVGDLVGSIGLKKFEKGIDNISILDYYINIQNGYR